MFSFRRLNPSVAAPPDNESRLDFNDPALIIHDSFEHGISGATLLLMERNNHFHIGWFAPWQRTITAYHTVPTEKAALRLFKDMKKLDPPSTAALRRDWQRNAVYAWEEATLDRTDTRMKIGEMEQIIKRISQDFNLAAAPSVGYNPPGKKTKNPYSYYFPENEHIQMTSRKLSHIIHEAAHAIDHQINGNVWAGHGPSFVRTLITLAERYQPWHDPAALEKSAHAAGLAIAPRNVMKFKPR